MQDAFRIGEVAKRADVSVDTVRYYERQGLLPIAPRTGAGYRVFTSEAIDRVLFIKQAQEIGFSLNEIRALVVNNGISDCRRIHDLLNIKLDEVDARLKRIRSFRGKLAHYLAECQEVLTRLGNAADCPVVEEIAHTELRSSKSKKAAA
ncbi:MAG: heavy metal-responsive transcriptional regulator [Acidobacteriota bacterium]